MAKISINMDSLKTRRETKRHPVKSGSNIFRFLPPFGDAANGYPYRKWQVIWGLKDPSSGRSRPFASSITHEKRCPVFEYLKIMKVKVETAKAEMLASGKTEEEVATFFKDINIFLGNLRPKTVFAWNAIDKSGMVGVVELKKTAHEKLITLMNEYIKDYNQDPTSLGSLPEDSGVWFNITREGDKLNTEYDAKKYQFLTKDARGIPSYSDDRSPLPDAIINDFNSHAYDLNSIYQKKTYDEMKDILIQNLSIIVQEEPFLKVEGFYIETEPVRTAPAQAAAPISPQTVAQPMPAQPIKAAAPKMASNLEAFKQQPTLETDEDFMAAADEIFNS